MTLNLAQGLDKGLDPKGFGVMHHGEIQRLARLDGKAEIDRLVLETLFPGACGKYMLGILVLMSLAGGTLTALLAEFFLTAISRRSS